MTTLFYILLILLGINAFLLVFSVNGAMDMFKKPLKKISETKIPSLLDQKYVEPTYKKAV